jgi:hypothetical protein
MNKFFRFLSLVFVAASLAIFTGCEKDPDNPHNSVPDPAGTITANISESTGILEWNVGSGDFRVRWCKPDNFRLQGYSEFITYMLISVCNLGTVAGLGNITEIPTSGFSNPTFDTNTEVACEVGHGYVIKIEGFSSTIKPTVYIRLYVVESIVSTSGGIMGAKVKYQYPFEP